MTRSRFLVVAAALPGVFGLVMLLLPALMLDNSLTGVPDDYTVAVTRWVGFAVLSVAVITFLSRNDDGSPALHAVMIGNVVFHLLGIAVDMFGYVGGTMTASGLVTGLVPHMLLTVGFVWFLRRGDWADDSARARLVAEEPELRRHPDKAEVLTATVTATRLMPRRR
jgi:hypothetical protein